MLTPLLLFHGIVTRISYPMTTLDQPALSIANSAPIPSQGHISSSLLISMSIYDPSGPPSPRKGGGIPDVPQELEQ
jgi:hypothetical protein